MDKILDLGGMKKIICLMLACLPAASSFGQAVDSVQPLDLTPHIIVRQVNELRFQCPYFRAGKSRYGVNLPIATSVSGDSGGVRFVFSELEGAVFAMKPSPLKPAVSFKEPDLEAYRKAALGFMVSYAKEPVIQKEQSNPFSINNWSSHRFVISSSGPGMRIIQEVTFLNFSETQQIVLITTADVKNIDEAAAKSFQIMNSFHLLRPDEDLSAPVNP